MLEPVGLLLPCHSAVVWFCHDSAALFNAFLCIVHNHVFLCCVTARVVSAEISLGKFRQFPLENFRKFILFFPEIC